MTSPSDPPRYRPPYFWISVVAAGIGVTILGVRLLTLPAGSAGTAGLGILLGLAVAAAVVIGMRVAAVGRLRAAEQAFPAAVTLPIAVGPETAAAFRWAAERFGDPALHVTTTGSLTIAIDAAGLHLVRRSDGPHGLIPASALTLGGEGRTMVGARVMDAVPLTVTTGDAAAPLPLVPMRLRGNPFRGLTAEERREVTRRVEAALRGERIEPGWVY